MKKKNRPSVPPLATLTLVYKGGGVDTFKRYGDGYQAAQRGGWPSIPEEMVWCGTPILGWVVVDRDGTVTIGPQ